MLPYPRPNKVEVPCVLRTPSVLRHVFYIFLRWLQMTIAQPSAYAQPSMIPFLKPHDMYCHLVLLTFQKVFGKGSKKRFQKNFFLTFSAAENRQKVIFESILWKSVENKKYAQLDYQKGAKIVKNRPSAPKIGENWPWSCPDQKDASLLKLHIDSAVIVVIIDFMTFHCWPIFLGEKSLWK